MKKFGIIYLVTNLVNSKQYVGQTQKTLEIRKNQHIKLAMAGTSKAHFMRAIKKYGIENFEFIELETCNSLNELNYCEEMNIIKYDSIDNGYNSMFGGDNYDRTVEMRNQRAEEWLIIDPDGKWEITTNLSQYCQVNDLHQGTMVAVSQDKERSETHKGYHCRKVVNGSPVMPEWDTY